MRRAAVLLASAALLGVPAATTAQPPAPRVAAIAKTCGSGYTHARIGGKEKCLRRGQFCAKRYRNSYPRYGFHCRRDSRDALRLR
jgi:hypothetical protein